MYFWRNSKKTNFLTRSTHQVPKTFLNSSKSRAPNKISWGILACARSPVNLLLSRLQLNTCGRFDYVAVAHLYYMSAHCCGFRVMSDHNDGLIEAVIQLLKHIQHEG